MARQFTREQFHELVWSKPMTHLARDFALSDVALHKICKKHGIPNPPLGWWAKKAAGKAAPPIALPPAPAGMRGLIVITGGELRPEPDHLAQARERARIAASALGDEVAVGAHPIVTRTVQALRKIKTPDEKGLVGAAEAGLVHASLAPASIDRFALALARIVAVAGAMDIRLEETDRGVRWICDDERIGFSISETVRRTKHVTTAKETAAQEAWRRRREGRSWNWTDPDPFPWAPDWDYHPTGQLAFELSGGYFWGGGSPRRSFRDAKIQRLEAMAAEIAVGITVFAAATRADRLRREAEDARREQERLAREAIARRRHIAERRTAAVAEILAEQAELDRLRRLVALLDGDRAMGEGGSRVAGFLALARRQLSDAEAQLGASGLESRFETRRLFGDDDDHGFETGGHHR